MARSRKIEQIFTPDQFTPTKHSTGEDKAKAANYLIYFLRNQCQWTLFHDWFYTELHQHFAHIAHYDRSGFYHEWFSTAKKQCAFVEDLLTNWMASCGDPAYTYSDVVRAVRVYLRQSNLLSELQARAEAEAHATAAAAARAALDRLPEEYRRRILQDSLKPKEEEEAVASPRPVAEPTQLGFLNVA